MGIAEMMVMSGRIPAAKDWVEGLADSMRAKQAREQLNEYF